MKENKSENVIILGASKKPHRYSYKAMQELNRHGHRTFLIGREPTGSTLAGNKFYKSIEELPKDIVYDTITIYLNERNQSMYEDNIMNLDPKKVIFNPGAENNKLYARLKQKGINVVNGCTLVMLSVGTFTH